MANDELTVTRAQERVARSMGWKRPSDWPSAYPVTEFFNEVGEWFCSLDWHWLARPPVYLATVNGQGYCELPEDFTQHLWVGGSSASSYSVSLEDPVAVGRAQAEATWTGGNYVACFTHGAPTSAGPKAAPRLDLGPIPTVSHAQAFVLVYKGGWTRCLDATAHIVLPAHMTSLYIMAASAWMAGLENEAGGSVPDRLDRLVASSVWQAAVDRDDRTQMDLGTMQGGVASVMGGGNDDQYPFGRYGGVVPIL